jgi:hypothetical protein
VITLTRRALSFGCALLWALSTASAQTAAKKHASLSELAALLAAQPKWNFSTAVKASYGYKDNLLLSFADEERSPFFRGNIDMLLLRLPQDSFDFSLYAEIESTQYTQGKSVKDDGRVWLRTEPSYRFGDSVSIQMPVTGYYTNQVFDVSDTEVERLVAELKVTGLIVGPVVRWDFHPAWWVEAQAIGHRKRYDDHVNDGDIGEGALRLGWQRGDWLKAQLAGAQRWRDFKSRTQYFASGRQAEGTHLKISEREGEFRVDVAWDEATRWKTSTAVSLLHYRDNGSGFFNFREQKIEHEVKWTSTLWLLRLTGSAARVDFGVQTVGLGIDPPARLRDEYVGEFYLERKLNDRWRVFSAYTWERSRSNDPVASYRVNEGLLGVRWSWDK